MVGRRTINIERRINRRLPIDHTSFLISVRILNRPNHHRFESPNKTFRTPIRLRIIRSRETMTNLEDLSKTLDNLVCKMRTVVRLERLGETETTNDVMIYEIGCVCC